MQFPDLVDRFACRVSLRLTLGGITGDFGKHGLQVGFDFTNGLVHFPERAVGVNIGELVCFDGLTMQQEHP